MDSIFLRLKSVLPRWLLSRGELTVSIQERSPEERKACVEHAGVDCGVNAAMHLSGALAFDMDMRCLRLPVGSTLVFCQSMGESMWSVFVVRSNVKPDCDHMRGRPVEGSRES